MDFLITTAPGLESLVKRECERFGYKPTETTDRSVRIHGWIEAMIEANLWLRCANRVYLVLAEGFATDFDDLYALAESVDWRKYRPKDSPILIETVSHKSGLTSEPAIQRTVKKAVIERLVSHSGEIVPEVDTNPTFRVLVLLRSDRASILLDTSGDPLHKRGYRQETGEAPVKETLAAAMIYLSSWRYKNTLIDPCCGSWTIPIEAAMIARNIAPGLRRHFAFEHWDWIPKNLLTEARDRAKTKIFPPGSYTIRGYDIDPDVLQKAEYNSKVAGVATDIVWESRDIDSGILPETENSEITIISNPPYGERLEEEGVDRVHSILADIFMSRPDVSGGVITNYEPFFRKTSRTLERRKLWNGSIECQYCYRKSAPKN